MKNQSSRVLSQIAEVVETVLGKIDDDTDLMWTHYDSPDELRQEIMEDLQALKAGAHDKLEVFRGHFLPTATFQELALSNGWPDEYLSLAKEFDKLSSRYQ